MNEPILANQQILNRAFIPESNSIRIAPDKAWNKLLPSKPDAVTEVYAFYLDDVLVETITITYEDSTKDFISELTKV